MYKRQPKYYEALSSPWLRGSTPHRKKILKKLTRNPMRNPMQCVCCLHVKLSILPQRHISPWPRYVTKKKKKRKTQKVFSQRYVTVELSTLTGSRVNEGLHRDGGEMQGGAFKEGKWGICWFRRVIEERLPLLRY